jgi:RNA polymerase sigma-70 factor (ECF subfamily)
MSTTPATLLERLRRPDQPEAWKRFVDLYAPLLHFWASRLGLQDSEAADLVQDVFLVLLQKLPQFRYDPDRSFRSWLRRVTINRWREGQRRCRVPVVEGHADELPGPNELDPAYTFWEQEYRRCIVHRVLTLIQEEFEPSTWKAFWECIVCDRAPQDVARELGLTINAVYIARSRVLACLRDHIDGLLD